MSDDEAKKIHLDEYKEVCANLREYGKMRFSQLTLVSAITGGSIAGAKYVTNNSILGAALPLIALGLTIAVWIMEESSTRYWIIYQERAVEIENIFGYNHVALRPRKRMFSATNAVRFVYISLTAFWSIFFLIQVVKNIF